MENSLFHTSLPKVPAWSIISNRNKAKYNEWLVLPNQFWSQYNPSSNAYSVYIYSGGTQILTYNR